VKQAAGHGANSHVPSGCGQVPTPASGWLASPKKPPQPTSSKVCLLILLTCRLAFSSVSVSDWQRPNTSSWIGRCFIGRPMGFLPMNATRLHRACYHILNCCLELRKPLEAVCEKPKHHSSEIIEGSYLSHFSAYTLVAPRSGCPSTTFSFIRHQLAASHSSKNGT